MTLAKEIIRIFVEDPKSGALTPELVRSLYLALCCLNPDTCKKGICHVATNIEGRGFLLLFRIFKLWPEFSGCVSYPIKAPPCLNITEDEAYCFFLDSSLMWHKDAIYGATRRRLLAFCLSVLEDLLEDTRWATSTCAPFYK